MGAAFTYKLEGLKELGDTLKELPTVSMQRHALEKALKKGGEPIAQMARDVAPYDPRTTKGYENSKHLRDTIKVSTLLKRSQRRGNWRDKTSVTVYIGSTSPHAHLVEFGTRERVPKKGPFTAEIRPGQIVRVESMGRMPANPFLRTAWDALKIQALKIFAEELRKEIYAAARRLAKKAERGKLTSRQIEGLTR